MALDKNSKNNLLRLEQISKIKKSSFKNICNAWSKRWLNNRIKNTEILEKIKHEKFEKLSNILENFS